MGRQTADRFVIGTEWFRTLAETASVAVFVYSRDRFLFVNPESARLTGHTVDEMLGMDPWSLVHPSSRDDVPRLDPDDRPPEAPAHPVELKIVRRDGEERWIAFTTTLVEISGQRAGLGTAVDITSAKRAQQALARRLELENLLADISHRFLRAGPAEIDTIVIDSIARITKAVGGDRGRLLRRGPDGTCFVCTHEWSRFATAPVAPAEVLPEIVLPWSTGALQRGRTVAVEDASRLPDEAAVEREVASAEGVRAWLQVPVHLLDRLTGCLRIEVLGRPRRWRDEDRRLVRLVSQVIGSALQRHEALVELRASRDWLALAQGAGRSIAWEWDAVTDRMRVSHNTAEIFGVAPDQVPSLGRELLEFVPADDRAILSSAALRTFKLGERYTAEHRVVPPDGKARWLVVHGQAVRNADGRVVRMRGVSADITERKRAEEALEHEKELAQVTLASIGDGVIRTDLDGRVDLMNPAAEALTGIDGRQAVGRPVTEVYTVRDEATGRQRPSPVERCLREGRVVESSDPVVLVRHDGSELAVRDSAAPIRDPRGRLVGTVLVIRDVTRLRGLEREMAYLASHDPLTGLMNRREFRARLAQAVRSSERHGTHHALCYLDLDDFKIVNDTSGHGAGDELLRQLAEVLAESVRPCDTLARLGGDEFAILLANSPVGTARQLAESLLGAVSRFRFVWQDRVFAVGASIGVIPVTGSGATVGELLSAADSACYVAKDKGRNQIHLSEPDDAELAARRVEMQWMERIGRALEEGRMVLYSQPIMPLAAAGPPVMDEVLLRLVEHDGVVIEPVQFISAAERFRLMPTIDRWVIDRALATIADLGEDAERQGRCWALNLSGQSLGDDGFLDYVVGRMAAHDVAGSQLCFEITETAAISNMSAARRFIAGLKTRGCRFVLDDFGSGLSSFRYLSRLEIDYLKIDGAIVRNMVRDPVLHEMVASTHRIARRMSVQTIGEWVEQPSVLEALRALGVDFGQGYLLARPQPFGEPGT